MMTRRHGRQDTHFGEFTGVVVCEPVVEGPCSGQGKALRVGSLSKSGAGSAAFRPDPSLGRELPNGSGRRVAPPPPPPV